MKIEATSRLTANDRADQLAVKFYPTGGDEAANVSKRKLSWWLSAAVKHDGDKVEAERHGTVVYFSVKGKPMFSYDLDDGEIRFPLK